MTQLWRRLGDKVIGKPHLSDIMWAWCILFGILSLNDNPATPSTTPPSLPVVIGLEGEVFKDGYSRRRLRGFLLLFFGYAISLMSSTRLTINDSEKLVNNH